MMSLPEVAYRLNIDPMFAQSLRINPEQTLSQAGICLDADEQKSLQLFLQNNPHSLSTTPDDGIAIDPWLPA